VVTTPDCERDGRSLADGGGRRRDRSAVERFVVGAPWALIAVVVTSLLTIAATLNDIL